MFADARTVPDGTALQADLVVVGGGAAGITLAREFAGSRLRVVLLESGDMTPDNDTQLLYKGTNTGLPYFPLVAARLRFFGGTTNHWGGVCRPFDEDDFEVKDGVPYSGWPISRAQLDRHYERAARICHLRSADWDLDTWASRDRASPLAGTGDRTATRVAQQVPKPLRSFGTTYRDDIARANNVTAYLNANVTEIETDDTARTATLVQVATLQGNRFRVAARAFVLAVGGIENPRILLASNRRDPRGLGNRYDLVGRFFLEHPRFLAGTIVPVDRNLSTRFYEWHPVGRSRIQGYLGPSPATRRAEGLVDVQVRVRPLHHPNFTRAYGSAEVRSLRTVLDATRSGDAPDELGRHVATVAGDLMRWHRVALRGAPLPLPYPEVVGRVMTSTPVEAQALIPDLMGDVAARAYGEVVNAPLDSLLLTTRIDQAPNPDSRVTLAQDRDALGVPQTQLDWRLSTLDRHSVRRTMSILGAEIGRAGLGRLRVLLGGDDEPWPDDLAGGWHHMGTTRMSADPKQGVVDADCRVHGMSNLFVAGSSVFPTAGSGTPTLLIVALALRLAEKLKGVLR